MIDRTINFAFFHNAHQNFYLVAQACIDVDSCVCFRHGVQGFIVCVIVQVPQSGVSRTSHDRTKVLECFESMSQVRPYSDAFPLDTCLFCTLECIYASLQVFFQLVSECLECDFSIILGTACNNQSHIVEQVETVQRRRFVLSHISDSVPVVYGTLCLVLNFFELLPVERLAADNFQLSDCISELVSNVCLCVFRNRHCVVERYIDYDAGNIQFRSKVFVPFQQCVTDVVTCNYQVGQRNISRRRVYQNFGLNACHSSFLQAFHIAHVYSAVRTAVDVVAFSFSYIQHIHRAFFRADTSCMCFGVNHFNPHCDAEFRRCNGSRPANQVASLFCLSCIFIILCLVVG